MAGRSLFVEFMYHFKDSRPDAWETDEVPAWVSSLCQVLEQRLCHDKQPKNSPLRDSQHARTSDDCELPGREGRWKEMKLGRDALEVSRGIDYRDNYVKVCIGRDDLDSVVVFRKVEKANTNPMPQLRPGDVVRTRYHVVVLKEQHHHLAPLPYWFGLHVQKDTSHPTLTLGSIGLKDILEVYRLGESIWRKEAP